MKARDLIEARSIPVTESGCWIWEGSTSAGYGDLTFERKHWRAHRLSYEAFKGSVPKGMLVCHTCDVRACVNPNHLFVGSYSANRQDCVRKGRHRNGTRPKGLTYKRPLAYLDLEIQGLVESGLSHRAVARRLGISHHTVSKAVR
jgi:DNA-binding CsgD family transcriptional regulator